MYVIQGPAEIGNIFGFGGKALPTGKWAVVADGEYANGGYGPSQVLKGTWDSQEEALAAAFAHWAMGRQCDHERDDSQRCETCYAEYLEQNA